jgi:c-di-GMP-binding flagellar brake protein YcgR
VSRDSALIPGERVYLVRQRGEDDATGRAGIVEEIAPEGLTVRTRGHLFAGGEVLRILRAIADDARYELRARVESVEERRVRLLPLAAWDRVQQREFVRLRLPRPLPMVVRRMGAGGRIVPEAISGTLVDLSAGGMQIEVPDEVETGSRVPVGFWLPGAGGLRLEARVVRRTRAPARDDEEPRFRVGLAFRSVPPSVATTILRWIHRQEAEKRRLCVL